jgi:protein CpxP
MEDRNNPLPTLPPSSDESRKSSPTGDTELRNEARPRGFVRGLLLGGVAAGLVGIVIGATMPTAEAAWHAYDRVQERGEGRGPGGHGDGPPSVEEMGEHAEFFVSFALHRLGATDEQEGRVLDIVDAAIGQASPLIEKHRTNREALRGLLTASTIDRSALEALRAEEIAMVDTLSRTLAGALADSAEVLTAEQRAELAEHLQHFRHRR